MRNSTRLFLQSMYDNMLEEETRKIEERTKKVVGENLKTMYEAGIIDKEEVQEFVRDKGISINFIKDSVSKKSTIPVPVADPCSRPNVRISSC